MKESIKLKKFRMLIGFSIFVAINLEGLRDISRLGIWVFAMILLFLVSIYGSFRIWTWIKEGKL